MNWCSSERSGRAPLAKVRMVLGAVLRSACSQVAAARLPQPAGFRGRRQPVAAPCLASAVYLAQYHETDVAVKILLSLEDIEGAASKMMPHPMLEGLRKEASMIAALRHPNTLSFIGYSKVPPCIITGNLQGSKETQGCNTRVC